MKNGRSPRDRTVSRQSRMNIAAIVLIATAMLLVTDDAVSVTTAWTPPTSFARRLWISPVRVTVNQRRGMRWRWPYSASRRSCMTRWPMTLFR